MPEITEMSWPSAGGQGGHPGHLKNILQMLACESQIKYTILVVHLYASLLHFDPLLKSRRTSGLTPLEIKNVNYMWHSDGNMCRWPCLLRLCFAGDEGGARAQGPAGQLGGFQREVGAAAVRGGGGAEPRAGRLSDAQIEPRSPFQQRGAGHEVPEPRVGGQRRVPHVAHLGHAAAEVPGDCRHRQRPELGAVHALQALLPAARP